MYTQNDGVDRVTGFENMANDIFVFIVIYIFFLFFFGMFIFRGVTFHIFFWVGIMKLA